MSELKENPSEKLFGLLSRAMNGNPALSQRITNHVRAVSGHNTLITYHRNGASETDKVKLYSACLVAIRENKFDKLLGQAAAGQASVEEEPEKKEEPKPREAQKKPKPVVQDVEFKETPAPEPVAVVAAASNDPADLLAASLRALMQQRQQVQIDEGTVKTIVEMSVASRIQGIENDLNEYASKRITGYLESIPARDVVEIRPVMGDKFDIPRQHYKFGLLMACLAQRIPVCMVGPAASSKSTAAKFAAEALNLKFGASNFGPTTSKSDLFGYKDATGNYHSTELVRTALEGGVWCGDEFDRGHAGVSTMLNMPLANRIIPLPDGTKAVHDDWVPVLTANTYGTGANRLYVGANQMDAATLDRMAFIEWDYDAGLEGALIGVEVKSPEFDLSKGGSCDPQRWLDGVCRTRAAIAKLGIRHLVTPRASIYGAKLLAAGVGIDHVQDIILWKGLDAESVRKVKEAM